MVDVGVSCDGHTHVHPREDERAPRVNSKPISENDGGKTRIIIQYIKINDFNHQNCN